MSVTAHDIGVNTILRCLQCMAQNDLAHRIQAPLTYIHSSHNYRTFNICINSSLCNLIAALAFIFYLSRSATNMILVTTN